jgi:hypothetical protein
MINSLNLWPSYCQKAGGKGHQYIQKQIIINECFRQYAHFVIAGIQFEKSITLFVSPLLFLFFIKDESKQEQWRNVFLGMALVLTVVK